MAYKITVEEIEESDDKYPNKKEIYSQTIENFDLRKVIAVINNSVTPFWKEMPK